MPRRPLHIAISLALLATACSVGVGTTSGSESGALARLRIETPDTIDWRRTIDGIEVAGSGVPVDGGELELIDAALSRLPRSLVTASGVETIYRVGDGDVAVEDATVAFTRGRDVYLIDRTFERSPGLFDMTAVLAHEFTHAAQFESLTDVEIEAALNGEVADPFVDSAFVARFAAAAGWSNDSATAEPGWVLDDPSGATAYGSSSPVEDMADTVARVVTGRANELSAARVNWVVDWLGTTAAALAAGAPYRPLGAEAIGFKDPLYDEQEIERRSPAHADPLYLLLPAGSSPARVIAQDVTSQLLLRGFAGDLRPAEGPIERYQGYFTRGVGLGFWVELWEFREAPGVSDPPNGPVLTYVILW